MNNLKKIEQDTRKSWELNWTKVGRNSIMEIFDYPRVKKSAQIYYEYLPKSGLILEAGCGLGQWVAYLGSKGYRILGVDYNLPTIDQARSYNSLASLAVADVRAMPFKDGSFDAYLSFGVIEHFIEGPDAAIGEAYRALKKGGIAIIVVPHRNIFTIIKSPFTWLKRSGLLRKILGKKEKIYYYQRYFKASELRKKLQDAGFKVLNYKPIDHVFSLVEFSGIFRDKNTFDGENILAVKLGNVMEKFFPHMSAGSNMFVLQK